MTVVKAPTPPDRGRPVEEWTGEGLITEYRHIKDAPG
jgi:hypothetical protein